ncbi:MAG: DNA double-strand break repair nuclease NurA [Candidatus Poribacteria bacterium]|nr:DNA double-strand break repair nuclease NurA [Candidatus Poribacteria bacterium]
MPYEGEFAKYRSIRRLVENERVKNLVERARIQDHSSDETTPPMIRTSEIPTSEWHPKCVIAIDGSHQETFVENGYPGAEVGYVTTAAVVMDIAKIKELDSHRPVNPKLFRETEKVGSIDSAFPGCNIVIDSDKSAKHSLSKMLFETFDEIKLFEGESLLGTYEALLEHKPEGKEPDCPYFEEGDCQADDKKYLRKKGTYLCPCPNKNMLYSTDALRVHERMVPDSANGEMFGEIMQVLERIVVIHILRAFKQQNALQLLKDIGIVIDGQLAVFGSPAWLHSAIREELYRLNKAVKDTIGRDLLIIGIEKSGTFVNHFERIDQDKHGGQGKFPPQTVSLLTDEYIKKNIIFSDSTKPYGLDTHFGRKLFYKTASGARLVASLPFFDDSHSDMTRADPNQYPRLVDALSLIDQLVSSRYPNSLSPLISAHAEAAIPMNIGARVLEEIAKLIEREENL